LKSNSPSDVYLGELEQQLLLVVLRLGDEAYANPIGEVLAKAAGRVVSRGALYTALERLEQSEGFDGPLRAARRTAPSVSL